MDIFPRLDPRKEALIIRQAEMVQGDYHPALRKLPEIDIEEVDDVAISEAERLRRERDEQWRGAVLDELTSVSEKVDLKAEETNAMVAKLGVEISHFNEKLSTLVTVQNKDKSELLNMINQNRSEIAITKNIALGNREEFRGAIDDIRADKRVRRSRIVAIVSLVVSSIIAVGGIVLPMVLGG